MASAIDWVLLDHTAAKPVEIGDVVSADAGGMPIYRVRALSGGQVWLGGDRDAAARIMPLDGFRWRGGAAAQGAAA
jgi:hypothetical protein